MKTHKCPIKTCSAVVPDSKLMCARHWHMVSIAQQRAVWREYRKAPQSTDHLQACSVAIAEVHHRLGCQLSAFSSQLPPEASQ